MIKKKKVVLKEELIKNDKSCLKRSVLTLHGNTNEDVSERKMNKRFVCKRASRETRPFIYAHRLSSWLGREGLNK